MALSILKHPSVLKRVYYHIVKHQEKRISITAQEKLLLPSSKFYKLVDHQRKQHPIIVQEKLFVPFLPASNRRIKFYFRNVRREVPLLSTHKIHATNNFLRSFSQKEQGRQKRPVPRIYYIQNPFYWLDNKISFRYLRRSWDPEFNEWEFRKGANQAVSLVTNLIATDNYQELEGLVTETEARYLRRVFAIKEYSRRIKHLGVDTDDIQVALPRKVNLTKHFEQKFCDIDMVYVAEKWTGLSEADKLALIVILARFHREFTEGVVPKWIITLFRVTKFKFYPSEQPRN